METCNMSGEKGRGIVIYIKSNIKYSLVPMNSNFEESLALDISTPGSPQHLLLVVIYRSPNSTEENNLELLTILNQVPYNNYTTLIVGDFNMPKINWNTWTTPTSAESKEYKLIEHLRDKFLSQLVCKPTRFRGMDIPSILDLVITNKEELVKNIEHHAGIGKSDHCVLEISVEGSSTNTNRSNKDFRNYNKGNYERLQNLLNRDWEGELQDLQSIEEKWNFFLSKYNEAVDRCTPKGTNRKFYKTALDPKVRKKIKEKNRLHHEFLRTKDENTMRKYRSISNQVRTLTRKAERNKEKKIAKDSKKNPKKFWKHVNGKLKHKSNIPDLKKDDGTFTADDKEKAIELGKFFTSVFTDEPTDPIAPIPAHCDVTLSAILLSPEMVKEELTKLDSTKSCGPDSIHPRILKETASVLSLPLSLIFNASLDQGTLPSDWKTAHIAAIHKKGNKASTENYRPVSLTSIVCKYGTYHTLPHDEAHD